MARSTRFSVTSGKSDVPAPIEEVSRADARALKKGKEPHITQGNKEIAKNKGEAEAAATSEATLAPFAPGREADKRKSAQKSPKTWCVSLLGQEEVRTEVPEDDDEDDACL